MSSELQEAYNALLRRAPGAAFRRARKLYLNKYPLPQAEMDVPFRLFICGETIDEVQQPAPDGIPGHRLVTLTSRPDQLALVHWQHNSSASKQAMKHYLQSTWNLDLDSLRLEDQSQSWFRQSGRYCLFTSPCELIYQQQSLLTLKE